MGQPWKREPARVAKRLNDASPAIDEDTRQHVALWAGDLLAQLTPDPRQQAVARAAIDAYQEYALMQAKRLTIEAAEGPISPGTLALVKALTRLRAEYVKWLRLLGIRPKAKQKPTGHEPAGVFTAPRERKESELEREELAVESGFTDGEAA